MDEFDCAPADTITFERSPEPEPGPEESKIDWHAHSVEYAGSCACSLCEPRLDQPEFPPRLVLIDSGQVLVWHRLQPLLGFLRSKTLDLADRLLVSCTCIVHDT